MKKKHRDRHTNKVVYAIPILAVISIIVVAALITSEPKTWKVSEILEITHTASLAIATGRPPNQNESILIKTLGLKITAVGGDAHSIIVIISSLSQREEPPVNPFLRRGETWDLPIELLSYPTRLNEDGFYPVKISVTCIEAAEDEDKDITIFLKPEDLIILPGTTL